MWGKVPVIPRYGTLSLYSDTADYGQTRFANMLLVFLEYQALLPGRGGPRVPA